MYISGNKDKKDQTATPEMWPQKRFNPKPCKDCGVMFDPKAPCEMYCSDACKDRGHTNARLERVYGISLEDYESIKETQEGLCAICKTEGFVMAKHHKMKLVVDHCHETDRVRGLLCHNCNRALGLLKDNTESLQRAIKYLD